MKIVYLFDGSPFLVKLNNEGEYIYPNDEWTEVPPPEGIYQPFYYNGNEWIGSTREEWASRQEIITEEPRALELLVSQLQLQAMLGDKKTRELEDKLAISEQTLAEAILKITELENQTIQEEPTEVEEPTESENQTGGNV